MSMTTSCYIWKYFFLNIPKLIHLFVETLDQYFGNVCELDIVFNFNKVYGILD
jgi:hypothetical protein